MHGFTIRQQNDPQVSPIGFLDRSPTPDAPILLHDFPVRIPDDSLYPLQPYCRAIWTLPHGLKIPCEFHVPIVAKISSWVVPQD
jgi:hypothetical protein